MTRLEDYGWSLQWQSQLRDDEQDLVCGRVVRQDSSGYRLITEAGECHAVVPGRRRQRADSRADLPAVGDWVLAEDISGDGTQLGIIRILDRLSHFSRNESGERTDQQILAANIDLVFIVAGLDGNFNPARIERFLLLARVSGAEPVLILNKSDLVRDMEIQQCHQALTEIIHHEQVLLTSTVSGLGMKGLKDLLGPGVTAAFLGSSGVGKSSLINALLDEDLLKTGQVRAGDSKGRHTTSHRELIIMPGGGILIDTPGMRELQLWTDEKAVYLSFRDIAELSEQCRFRNCRHEQEPGCAVKASVEDGLLEAGRLARFQRYLLEVAELKARQEAKRR